MFEIFTAVYIFVMVLLILNLIRVFLLDWKGEKVNFTFHLTLIFFFSLIAIIVKLFFSNWRSEPIYMSLLAISLILFGLYASSLIRGKKEGL